MQPSPSGPLNAGSNAKDLQTRPKQEQRPFRFLAILPYCPNAVRGRVTEAIKELGGYGLTDVIILDDGLPCEVPEVAQTIVRIPNASRLRRILRILWGLIHLRPITYQFYSYLGLKSRLKNFDISSYDAVYVHRLRPKELGLKHPAVIFDCVDCMHGLAVAFSRTVPGPKRLLYWLDALLLKKYEPAACEGAACVLVAADREIPQLKRLGVRQPIIGWYDRTKLGAPCPALKDTPGPFVLTFHGKLSFSANVLALRRLEELYTRLDPSRFTIQVVGKSKPLTASRYPGLNFLGFVDNIVAAVGQADLGVFPMDVSVGFSNKGMETLAAGVPILVTPNMTGGLPDSEDLLEMGIFVREMEKFPAFIEEFSKTPLKVRQEISENCWNYARSVFNSSKRKEHFGRILQGCQVPVTLAADEQLGHPSQLQDGILEPR